MNEANPCSSELFGLAFSCSSALLNSEKAEALTQKFPWISSCGRGFTLYPLTIFCCWWWCFQVSFVLVCFSVWKHRTREATQRRSIVPYTGQAFSQVLSSFTLHNQQKAVPEFFFVSLGSSSSSLKFSEVNKTILRREGEGDQMTCKIKQQNPNCS